VLVLLVLLLPRLFLSRGPSSLPPGDSGGDGEEEEEEEEEDGKAGKRKL